MFYLRKPSQPADIYSEKGVAAKEIAVPPQQSPNKKLLQPSSFDFDFQIFIEISDKRHLDYEFSSKNQSFP